MEDNIGLSARLEDNLNIVEDTPKFNREKHIIFLKYAFKSLGSHTSMDVHKMTILYFVLGSLKILKSLTEHEKEMSIRFVLGNVIVKNKKIIGFRAGSFTGWSFNQNYKNWNLEDKPHLASTYCALCILYMCDLKDMENVNLKLKEIYANESEVILDDTIFEEITKSQNSSGQISVQSFDTENDVRFFYCAMAIFKLLGKTAEEIKRYINYENGVKFLNSISNYEGGFSMTVGGESNGGCTFCTIASFHILNAKVPDIDNVLFWLNSRNSTLGVTGRTNKSPDSCYSFWIMGSLSVLNELRLFDRENTLAFLMNCQTNKVFILIYIR